MAQQIPETGFLRLWQIIGDDRREPPALPLIPVKKSTWWDGVRKGRFPKPLKLGPRTTVWRVEDIRDLIKNGACDRRCSTVATCSSSEPSPAGSAFKDEG